MNRKIKYNVKMYGYFELNRLYYMLKMNYPKEAGTCAPA